MRSAHSPKTKQTQPSTKLLVLFARDNFLSTSRNRKQIKMESGEDSLLKTKLPECKEATIFNGIFNNSRIDIYTNYYTTITEINFFYARKLNLISVLIHFIYRTSKNKFM